MTYDPTLFAFKRVTVSGNLPFTLGVSQLGSAAADARTTIPISAATISEGYTIEPSGYLSLDPATASASMTTYEDFVGSQINADITVPKGSLVELIYDGDVLFKGILMSTSVTYEADSAAFALGKAYTKRISYNLTSLDVLILEAPVAWISLPQETALARLQRWLTVNTADLTANHATYLSALVPAEESAGTSTYLEQVRAFTAATGLPVRRLSLVPSQWASVKVMNGSTLWTDQPLTPAVGPLDDDAKTWISEATYGDDFPAYSAVGVQTDDFRPISMSVKHNDDRLLVAGFRPPEVVATPNGYHPVAKLTQSFGKQYSATIELGPAVLTPAVRST